MQFDHSEKLKPRAFKYEKIDYGDKNGTLRYIQMFAFVDRLFPSFIAKYTQGGYVLIDFLAMFNLLFRIVAAYLAIVYFAARIIRSVVTSEPLDVIIQEMPNPDYLLKICLDIYLVREAHDVSFCFDKIVRRKRVFEPEAHSESLDTTLSF